jgi:hypothetical protein
MSPNGPKLEMENSTRPIHFTAYGRMFKFKFSV